jgi:DUF4097 and DUF4098 domain-containing protein YvlB
MIHRLILLGLLTAGLVHADTVHERTTESRALAPDGVVTIDNVNGSITITPWDRPEVAIEIDKSASNADALSAIEVTIDSTARTLGIHTHYPHHFLGWLRGWGAQNGEVQLTLRVPASARLRRIEVVNGGITITGVAGLEIARSVNGRIEVSDLPAGGRLSTVNGAIHVRLTAFNPTAKLSLATVNGSVTVQLAKTVNAEMQVHTVNGGTDWDLPLAGGESGRHRGPEGTLGTGGGLITATTVNGGVRFQSL